MALPLLSFTSDQNALRRFADLPLALRHAPAESTTPPDLDGLAYLLSAANPDVARGPCSCFLLTRDGQVAARCAALVSARYAEGGAPVGLLAFFESEPDPSSAEQVIDAALAWLRRQGVHVVWGPMDGSIWRRYRFMTRGFERTPFLGEPRNPPHYPAYLERVGFTPRASWTSVDLGRNAMQALLASPLERPSGAGAERLTIRTAQMEDELPTVHALVDATYGEYFGYYPVGLDDFRRRYGPVLADGILILGEQDGAPVSFAAGYGGRAAAPLREEEAGGGPSRVVLYAFGLLARLRGLGLLHHLIARPFLEESLRRGFDECVVALAYAERRFWDHVCESSRAYVLYEKRL